MESASSGSRSAVADDLFEVVRVLESHALGVRVAREQDLDLTWLQVRALWFAASRPPLVQRELADLLGISAPTVSKLCGRLVDLGHITTQPGPDPRQRVIRLTDQGRAAATRLQAGGERLVAAATSDWQDEDVAALARVLSKLRSSLRPLTD